MSTPELTVSVDADLGKGASATGNLLFLALKLKDGVSGYGTSNLHLGASVDLVDPGTGANADRKLTFSELTTSPLSAIFKPKIDGSADFLATATVDFSTIDPSLGNVLPSVSADLLAHFGFSATPSTGFHVDPPSLALANINLDLGSFISDFASPILGKIKDVLSPLAWLIGPDGFLNRPPGDPGLPVGRHADAQHRPECRRPPARQHQRHQRDDPRRIRGQ